MIRNIKQTREEKSFLHEGEKPLPRRIADYLLARIFVGDFKPGDKLPPDRILAEQLGVDRTSLRSALSELAGRNIIKAVQGSGVVVLDYRENAGLDFLDAVFAMPDINLGSALNLELLDHVIDVLPAIVKAMLTRATHSELAMIDKLFLEQLDLLKKGASILELAELEVKIQDVGVNLAGSMILKLFANSMRKLRVQFAVSFLSHIDLQKHIKVLRAGMQEFVAGKVSAEEISERFRKYLKDKTSNQRQCIANLASNPSWKTPATQKKAIKKKEISKKKNISAGRRDKNVL
jgi:GntR family transcriptional regulator, transcriptional repressor for pyruvate dehydrogenase complex